LRYCIDKNQQDYFIKCAEYSEIDLTIDDHILPRLAIALDADKILKYLIDNGLDISCCDNYLIKTAAYNGNCNSEKVLKVLIEAGADFTIDNKGTKEELFRKIDELSENIYYIGKKSDP